MVDTNITAYLFDELAKSENLFSAGGLKKVLKELMNLETYEKYKEKNVNFDMERNVISHIPMTYYGKKKIHLCCVPGCNIPTYCGHRVCECHKHEYENLSPYKLRKMFPEQREIPMIGIYGAFWTWLHEYMNKRNKKTGFEAAKQEHRMNRIIQYIAASTILTVEDIEMYLMSKPTISKNFTNKCEFEKGVSLKPAQVVDRLLINEAELTNILINR